MTTMSFGSMIVAIALAALQPACSTDAGSPAAADALAGEDTTAGEDTAGGEDTTGADVPVVPDVPDPADAPDVPAPVDVPGIAEALSCRAEGGSGQLGKGAGLQRHDLDLTTFPDALCNDGTGAVFYFRPGKDATGNRWIIQLEGGGGCRRGDDCAKRWCGKDTNFSSAKMSSDAAPKEGVVADGIMGAPPTGGNPWEGWNQVIVRYCSSDSWGGTVKDRVLKGTDPKTLQPVTYRVHFLGTAILGAVVKTLRQDGVAGPQFQVANGSKALPDLDDAEEVVLAGASAGGAGTKWNLDWLTDTLVASNAKCQTGALCPLIVRGLVDSSFGPAGDSLEWPAAICSGLETCTYEAFWKQDAIDGGTFTRGMRLDASCVAWHEANAPGSEWICADDDHTIRHHVTTPFFVRMGQKDKLISGNTIESGFTSGGAPMTLELFAELVRGELAALADVQTTAHEGAAIATAPGAFGPTCSDHETLSRNAATFKVTIDNEGTPLSMFDVWNNWVGGKTPTILMTEPGGADVCQ